MTDREQFENYARLAEETEEKAAKARRAGNMAAANFLAKSAAAAKVFAYHHARELLRAA